MTFSGSAGDSTDGTGVTDGTGRPRHSAVPAHHATRFRAGSVVALGLVTALVAGSAGAGLVAGMSSGSTRAEGTAVTGTNRGSASVVSPWSGRGHTDAGASPQTPPVGRGQAAVSPVTTPASTEQSIGVVVIDTVLGYQTASVAGTGIVLTSTGEILTNNHVIDGATSIGVTVVSTGASYVASVVGTDSSQDIAVLQLTDASGLATAPLDTVSAVAVGDTVTGVGNAGGTGSLAAAAGTMTGLDQTITATGEGGSAAETLTGLIQVDADIQAGDSGGPLYDADGEVIGVDTAASSGTGSITGYAIGIQAALGVVSQIDAGLGTGTITVGYPAFLGVEIDRPSGVIVGVATGSSAATVGLTSGDTITAIDGTAVDPATGLAPLLAVHGPGDSIVIDWLDTAGGARSATVVLAAGPAD